MTSPINYNRRHRFDAVLVCIRAGSLHNLTPTRRYRFFNQFQRLITKWASRRKDFDFSLRHILPPVPF
jgi:hypothetical protein